MDEVLLNKAATIERCLKRVREEYQAMEGRLDSDQTRQDAIVLNLLRTAEAAIDAAMHLVRIRRLGIPQQSRDAFRLLEENGILDPQLGQRMQAMVGFRNIAVHDYQQISLPILKSILDHHLEDFSTFVRSMLGSQ